MRELITWVQMYLAGRDDEEGQGMVEYGLIIALVAIVVIAALMILGPKVANIFYTAGNALNS